MARYSLQNSVGIYVSFIDVWLFDPNIYLLTLQECN